MAKRPHCETDSARIRSTSSSAPRLSASMSAKTCVSIFTVRAPPLLLRRCLHCVPAEFVAHDGQQFVRKGLWILGPEARVEGPRNHRQRNAQIHALKHGPASLAGICHVGLDAFERG